MKVASIDIGSNTLLLLIAEVDIQSQSVIPILNEYRMPRISKGLKKNSFINAASIESLFNVLQEYKNIIEKHNCSKVILNATQALRVASNSTEIIDSIKSKFGFDVNVISGNHEAYLSFLGANSGLTSKYQSIVIDIGGASTEVIAGSESEIYYQKSFPIGVVTMTERYLKSSFSDENFELNLSNIFSELGTTDLSNLKVIAVAGTPTTLACAKQNLSEYSDEKVEGFILKAKDLKYFITSFKSMNSDKIRKTYGKIMDGKGDRGRDAGMILLSILNLIGNDYLYTSTRGLRYGAIVDYIKSIDKE